MNINPNIFRAYDIRGIAGEDLTPEFAELLGKAFGTYLIATGHTADHSKIATSPSVLRNDKKVVAVSRDNRPHGVKLMAAFITGLTSTGCSVVDLGELPTPLLYFAVSSQLYDAGVSITASHNPKEYNGFKLVGQQAASICGEEIQKIRRLMESGSFREGSGTASQLSIQEEYLQVLRKKVSLGISEDSSIALRFGRDNKRMKIVVDCANGIAGQSYPKVFESLGCQVIKLYCESDGTFPHHEPDPIVEKNLVVLKERVKTEKADLGFAFDGDGDRVSVVDENGIYHDANQTLVLLAKDILSRNPGAHVVYTVSCSSIVPEQIKSAGGISHMVPVGHSFVEQKMHEHHALVGGEQSGHYFVAENYFSFDDACYSACKLLALFAGSNEPSSSHYACLPKVYDIPEQRPHCPDDKKFDVVKRVTESFLSAGYSVETMDGARVDFGDGAWAGIRASNTSPCLSICMEAMSQKKLEEVEALAKKILKEEGVDIEG